MSTKNDMAWEAAKTAMPLGTVPEGAKPTDASDRLDLFEAAPTHLSFPCSACRHNTRPSEQCKPCKHYAL